MFTIKEIIEITGGKLLQGHEARKIVSVHFDSREMREGALFVALTGGSRDGHEFLRQAAEQGGEAALISDAAKASETALPSDFSLVLVPDTEKAFQVLARTHRNRLAIPIVAITGSNGKTTTKDILAHILSGKMNVYKTYKNFNNHLGVPLSLLQMTPDTQVGVLELGMNHAGEIDFLAGMVRPTYTVITNVNDAHIEFFGTRERIAEAKGEILPHTDPDGFACLNLDNDLVPGLAHLNPGKTYFYHIQQEGEPVRAADITASSMRFDESGSHFVVQMNDEKAECFMPLFGKHNVSNALPGIFIARQLGLSLPEITEQLRTLEISSMRFERIDSPSGLLMINDAYNASPSSMLAAVTTFLSIYPERKKVLVLGDMFELGDQSETYHEETGKALKEMGNDFHLVTVGQLSKHITDAYGSGSHFDTLEDAASHLARFKSSKYAMLFKASRGMKFEKLASALL
ncbi:UDP-N-acetylmuramoyl-tripeptide--D-alanyl-D-alanine ligase [Aneurinibacillus terranovensis]|uniref:UDP-N-acetylmuramoyl-tripeptide--D-alanyl-D- alanine ligase n=1 Tax=Aneurinibacillus terranovensis TaxID=278991 RepID=UPI00041C7AE7|nr:UDP-N-acetylmuramoyl-tripeptide--D-alanyl-D-alanine ligase [Aneurinibacillus terranovensis]